MRVPIVARLLPALLLVCVGHQASFAESRPVPPLKLNIKPPERVIRTFKTQFNLDRVPQRLVLHLGFKISTAGWCPTTYQPTTVSINGRTVKRLDFRHIEKDNTLRIPIEVSALRVGENSLQIRGGLCQYQYDRFKIKRLSLS